MIYLIRHGETEFNREDRVQGRVDSPLTELGRAQARAMGERLAEIAAADPGDWRVETSPLGRARQTADIVAAVAGLPPPAVEPRLEEVSYGEMEGLTRNEVDRRWPQFAGVEGMFGQAPGGETLEALAERVGAWLAAARQGAADRRLVAVTHAGVVRVARGLHLGLDAEGMRRLDKPQGVIFRLHEGGIERLECRLAAQP